MKFIRGFYWVKSINTWVPIISWTCAQPIHSSDMSNVSNQKSRLTFCPTHDCWVSVLYTKCFLMEIHCMGLINNKVCLDKLIQWFCVVVTAILYQLLVVKARHVKTRQRSTEPWHCNASDSVAGRWNVHRTNRSRLRRKFANTGSVKDLPRSELPRKSDQQDDHSIKVHQNQTVSAQKLQQDLRRERNVRLSTQTIHRCIKAAGLTT